MPKINKHGKTIHDYKTKELRYLLDKSGIAYIARDAPIRDHKTKKLGIDRAGRKIWISKMVRKIRGPYTYKTYLWNLCLQNQRKVFN